MTWFVGFAWCIGLHLQGLLLQYLLDVKVFGSEVFLVWRSSSPSLLGLEVLIFKAFRKRSSSSSPSHKRQAKRLHVVGLLVLQYALLAPLGQ
jgi:hypothetical protein